MATISRSPLAYSEGHRAQRRPHAEGRATSRRNRCVQHDRWVHLSLILYESPRRVLIITSKTSSLPCYLANRCSSPARSSYPSPESAQDISRTQARMYPHLLLSFALPSQPTSIIGHPSRPKARLRDHHLDRIRAALHTPTRIHRPPSLSCRSGLVLDDASRTAMCT